MKMPVRLFLLTALLVATTVVAAPPLLPNHKLTPGVATNLTADQLCAKSFHTRDERFVTEKTKQLVYKEYGIASHKPHEYEVDHLISLELGGSNDIHNLWPQSYVTQPWNAHVKDQLETRLHWMICHKQVTLTQAQHAIATNWIAAYKKYIAPQPLAKLPPATKATPKKKTH